ncbi:hypothetical protein LIT25_28000 (plasmid) [Bacillus sp. F19]|nr:hypothetical protein LIT25_28000 [Bacillus sp. F19]
MIDGTGLLLITLALLSTIAAFFVLDKNSKVWMFIGVFCIVIFIVVAVFLLRSM